MDKHKYERSDYREFWKGSGQNYLDRLEKKIVRHELPQGCAIADIGAGYGRLAGCYMDKFKIVHMVEPAQNLRTIAQTTFGARAHYWDADVYELPFEDQSLDAVVMIRLLHHLTEPAMAIAEIHRTLIPNGVLIFNYSNKTNLRRVVSFLLKRNANPFRIATDNYSEDLYGHHPKMIQTILTTAGFVIRVEFGTGLVSKLIQRSPICEKFARQSLLFARLAGYIKTSPFQFVVAIKT